AVDADDGAGHFRAVVRSPYKIGDPTAFAMPAPLGPVQFAVTGNNLAATWSTLPDYDTLELFALAFSADGSQTWFDDREVSHRYIDATSAANTTLDTDIPGYLPAWRIDYAHTASVDRALIAAKASGNDLVFSEFEDLTSGMARRIPAERRELAKRVNRW